MRGYHFYKNLTWEEARVGEKVLIELETDNGSKDIDPYWRLIKVAVVLYPSK